MHPSTPRRGVAASLAVAGLLALAAPRAHAAEMPTWTPAEEGWGAWSQIDFSDPSNTAHPQHSVWCRWSQCFAPNHPSTAPLFTFEQVGNQVPFEMVEWQFGWPPRRTWTAYKTTFKTTLSHYSVNNGNIVRDDGHWSMPLSQASTPGSLTATGSTVFVHPPTSMADDGPAAAPPPTRQPPPQRPPRRPHPGNNNNNNTPTPQPEPTPTNNNNNNNNSGATDDLAAADAAMQNDFSPIERAIIKHIATPAELHEIASGTIPRDKNWHAIALDKARHDTDNPATHELRDFVKTQGFDDKAFAAYVGCDSLLPTPADSAGGAPLAMDQLQAQYRRLSIPGGPTPESIRSQADVFSAVRSVYPGLQQFCQDTANAGKVQEQQRPGGPAQSLSVVPPPAPGPGGVTPGGRVDPVPPAPPAGSAKDDSGKKKGDWTDQMVKGALGGTVGALGGLLVASVLGLGPFGFLAAVIAGAAIGVYVALKKDKKG